MAELGKLIGGVIAGVVTALADGLGKGDWSVLDRPVRELLSPELKAKAALARAEAGAAAKLGPRPA